MCLLLCHFGAFCQKSQKTHLLEVQAVKKAHLLDVQVVQLQASGAPRLAKSRSTFCGVLLLVAAIVPEGLLLYFFVS